MAVRSVGFLGVRTERFAEMVTLYRDALDLPLIHESEHAAWFQLEDGAELHLYAAGDEDHRFFKDGPVPGLLVDDFNRARDRLVAAGCSFIGVPQRTADAVWNHYRAPDGNVYEIMQRLT